MPAWATVAAWRVPIGTGTNGEARDRMRMGSRIYVLCLLCLAFSLVTIPVANA